MPDILSFVVHLCCDLMLLNSIYRMLGLFCDRSKVDRRVEYLVYGVVWLLSSLSNILLGIPMVNILTTLAALLALSFFLYPGWSFYKLACTLGVTALLMLSETAVYGLLLLCRISKEEIILLGTPMSRLMIFFLSLTVERKWRARGIPQASRLYWISVVAIPGGTIGVMLLLSKWTAGVDGSVFLSVAAILLLVDLLVFYVLDRMEAYSAAYYQQELLAEQNRAYQAEWALLGQRERRMGELRQDMKDRLTMLRTCAAQGRTAELKGYLNAFSQQLASPGLVRTGNPDIDSILNYKLDQARRAGARLEVEVRLPEGLKAELFDLNVILGNLMDNAAEALARCEDKFLSLTLRADRGLLFLRVVNSYDGLVLTDGAGYRTRKEGGEHGLGLGIVQRTVDKYHGQMRIHRAETLFTVEVLLYLEE